MVIAADALTPDLLRRARLGDPLAAADLDRLCREPLLRFCLGYLAREDDARDAAQEVLLRALAPGELPERVRPWLYRIARNHCANLARDQARRRESPLPSSLDVVAKITGPSTHAERAEVAGQVAALLARLSPTERELLTLRYVEDLSRAEIAELLELPESTVKSRLWEAVQKLRGAPARDAWSP